MEGVHTTFYKGSRQIKMFGKKLKGNKSFIDKFDLTV